MNLAKIKLKVSKVHCWVILFISSDWSMDYMFKCINMHCTVQYQFVLSSSDWFKEYKNYMIVLKNKNKFSLFGNPRSDKIWQLNAKYIQRKTPFHQSPTRHGDYIVTRQWGCNHRCFVTIVLTTVSSRVTVLPAVNNSDYTITVQSL